MEVFSKHNREDCRVENSLIRAINNEQFIDSIVSAEGVLCNAGFQTPAETIFLKKKLLVVPMKGQYEQHCNAAALKMLGVPVIKNIKPNQYTKVKTWVEMDGRVMMDFPDETEHILNEIIEKFDKKKHTVPAPKETINSTSRFRNLLLKKIFHQKM